MPDVVRSGVAGGSAFDRLRNELYDAERAVVGTGTVRADELENPPSWIAEGSHPWAIFGSFPLYLWGLRERFSDVDVFVAPEIWVVLANRLDWSVRVTKSGYAYVRTVLAGGVEAYAYYFAWSPGVDAHEVRLEAEDIHGWPCAPLRVIAKHKAASLYMHGAIGPWKKHQADLDRINDYLREAEHAA
jgi:hypothetical protein